MENNNVLDAIESPTLAERQKDMEAAARAHNGNRKPQFGDSMRNPWAGEGNPYRDGYFVREKRVTGSFNPGLWYQMTDGQGAFWETNGKVAMFREAPASTVPDFIARNVERAIQDAMNPQGMHTNGPCMARVEVSQLQRLLLIARAVKP